MSHYKLTYFDFDGGRGEPVRIALHAAGIDFEDHRIPFEEFMQMRPTMRFTCTPVLEMRIPLQYRAPSPDIVLPAPNTPCKDSGSQPVPYYTRSRHLQ